MGRVHGGSRGSQASGAATCSEGSYADRRDMSPERLPCSTSPMVVPEAAVDIVAGAVVCLPTVSTRLEMRGGAAETRGGRGKGREETKEAEED